MHFQNIIHYLIFQFLLYFVIDFCPIMFDKVYSAYYNET